MSSETTTLFNIITDILTALSAVVVATLAVYGVLWEWKKQMKGKTDYEIARRFLRASLQVRDAMKYVRNPFVSLGEMQAALKENGIDSEEYKDNEKTNRAVYSIRWKKVLESWTNLEAEVIEAEVSWGSDAVKAQESLNKAVRKLNAFLGLFLRGHSKEDKNGNELIYDMGEEDEFTKEVSVAINEIEDFLKPHLK